jgi:hypothetical protein
MLVLNKAHKDKREKEMQIKHTKNEEKKMFSRSPLI